MLASLLAATFLVGCGGKSGGSSGDKNTSGATGWKINAKEGGFQYNTNFKEQITAPGLVFVEGGTFTMGKVQDDVMHDWNNTPSQQHVQSFYMDETEVTNKMYMEYLDWLKQVFPPEDKDGHYKNIYLGALPDTLVWRSPLSANETMVNEYLRHPAYASYPVVGVNWVQAVQFSSWRTNRVNESMLEKDGFIQQGSRYQVDAESTFSTDTYLNTPENAYGRKVTEFAGKKATNKEGNPTYAKHTDGILLPEYRLPTEVEWEYAAKSLSGIREYNSIRGRKKYPWAGRYTRNGRRAIMGNQMANFKQGQGDYGGLAGWSEDSGDITTAVKTFEPNDFGLYDMAGNVAEWVADVYRPIVDDELSDFNYYRGNVYTKNKIGEDGKFVIVDAQSITYDTLSNGRIIARNLPGQLAKVAVDENETYLRYNFTTADNRNFRDGDRVSSKEYVKLTREKTEVSLDSLNASQRANVSRSMYNSPNQKIIADGQGGIVKVYDRSNDRTTLVDDESRVFKGGSWRDRAYYIDQA